MAREKEEFSRITGTVIGAGVTIEAARITGTDAIRIDGTVIGNIDLDGTLQLSETGRIDGDLRINAATLAGQIKGNIICRSALHMASTAIIQGDIVTAAFIVDEGAVLDGFCKTHSMENKL